MGLSSLAKQEQALPAPPLAYPAGRVYWQQGLPLALAEEALLQEQALARWA